MNYRNFEIGDRVLVSDGTKRPPDRFNRKLAAWKDRNYTGWVEEIEEPRDYAPHGTLVLGRDDYPDEKYGGVAIFRFHVPLGGSLEVNKMKEVAAA